MSARRCEVSKEMGGEKRPPTRQIDLSSQESRSDGRFRVVAKRAAHPGGGEESEEQRRVFLFFLLFFVSFFAAFSSTLPLRSDVRSVAYGWSSAARLGGLVVPRKNRRFRRKEARAYQRTAMLDLPTDWSPKMHILAFKGEDMDPCRLMENGNSVRTLFSFFLWHCKYGVLS